MQKHPRILGIIFSYNNILGSFKRRVGDYKDEKHLFLKKALGIHLLFQVFSF